MNHFAATATALRSYSQRIPSSAGFIGCRSTTRLGSSFNSARAFSSLVTNPMVVVSTSTPQKITTPTVRAFTGRTVPLMMTTSSPTGDAILESFQSASSSSTPLVGRNVALAMETLAKADAVCFDVDSTVIAEEGIDVLAEYLGKGEAVAALTRQAMEGSQKFQDALKQRLELLKPSKQSILACVEENPFQVTPGVSELIEALTENGVDVYFVSGGFRIMIEPIAFQVAVAKDRIFANTILFDDEGNYAGFDPNEPTSADMGKPKALQKIKEEHKYTTMLMIGDGATDAQAKPPADAFIGFGGVVVRPAVEDAADWFVKDFSDMTRIVEKFGEKKRR